MISFAGAAEQLCDDVPESSVRTGKIIPLSLEDLMQGANNHSVVNVPASYVEVITEADEASGFGSNTDSAFEMLHDVVGIPQKPLRYRFIKRAFDIVFSICVIVIGFVPGLVLSAFIVADTKGSPIYLSNRVGRNGKSFRLLKFRSMVADSDNLEKYFTAEQLDQWHREHKVENDPRVTKLGAFLRSSSIDEFPQFINVLFGQMSTIGSRAVTEEEAEYYGEARDIILSMRPGIAWDIIAPKPEAGKKVSGARVLPAYKNPRMIRAVAA